MYTQIHIDHIYIYILYFDFKLLQIFQHMLIFKTIASKACVRIFFFMNELRYSYVVARLCAFLFSDRISLLRGYIPCKYCFARLISQKNCFARLMRETRSDFFFPERSPYYYDVLSQQKKKKKKLLRATPVYVKHMTHICYINLMVMI